MVPRGRREARQPTPDEHRRLTGAGTDHRQHRRSTPMTQRPSRAYLADPGRLRQAQRRAGGPQGSPPPGDRHRISAAREEGDLSENGGYHAAKEDQGKNEGKIRQLEGVLEHADHRPPPRTTASSRWARSSPTSSRATPTTRPRPSCSAPARTRSTSRGSPSTPRRRRSGPPCSAPRPAASWSSRAPTAARTRSRSSSAEAVRRLKPARLLEHAVAALAQPGEHLLGVGFAAGLQLEVHLDLVEVQRR